MLQYQRGGPWAEDMSRYLHRKGVTSRARQEAGHAGATTRNHTADA